MRATLLKRVAEGVLSTSRGLWIRPVLFLSRPPLHGTFTSKSHYQHMLLIVPKLLANDTSSINNEANNEKQRPWTSWTIRIPNSCSKPAWIHIPWRIVRPLFPKHVVLAKMDGAACQKVLPAYDPAFIVCFGSSFSTMIQLRSTQIVFFFLQKDSDPVRGRLAVFSQSLFDDVVVALVIVHMIPPNGMTMIQAS